MTCLQWDSFMKIILIKIGNDSFWCRWERLFECVCGGVAGASWFPPTLLLGKGHSLRSHWGSHHLHRAVLQQQEALRSLGVMTASASAAAAARGHTLCRPLYPSLWPVCIENHVMQPQQAALTRQSPLTGDTVQHCVIPCCLQQQQQQ